jgi:enoyl-CoA hydratase/carnithine racemase
MSYETIQLELLGPVGVITLNRPTSLNALSVTESERKAQIQSGLTRDFKEGVAAFIEKRPPRFAGG